MCLLFDDHYKWIPPLLSLPIKFTCVHGNSNRTFLSLSLFLPCQISSYVNYILFSLILFAPAFYLNVVTMQALRTAPPDMQLKDKFLVQTTVVPYGTSDEDLVPAFVSI